MARGELAALAALAEWAAARADAFTAVAQMRDADAPAAARALEIVRAFIVERGLVLYGGQAIDYALRLRGARIYPDHQTPDFDFFSSDSVADAYDLAERLHAAGFPGVGAIPAIHVQTMRVKTDFIFVADISFAPPAVFARLPTVSFAGMRVLHPDYQRLDMHLAFCFPFNNPPREDAFNRFAKDLKRFRLFQEHFPVARGEPLNAAVGEPPNAVAGGAAAAPPRRVECAVDFRRAALHGFAAYGALRATLDSLVAAAEADAAAAGSADAADTAAACARARAALGELPALPVGVGAADADGLRPVAFEAPPALPAEAARLVVATPWPRDVVAALAAATGAAPAWSAPYMDARPLAARVGPVDVYSTRRRLLAVSSVEAPAGLGLEGGGAITLASPQFVLLFFLLEAHLAPDAGARDAYVDFYTGTLRLLELADAVISALRAAGGGPEVPADKYRAFVDSSPFGLTVKTLGDANHDASYLIRLAASAKALGDTPPGVDPAELAALAVAPPKYFPAAGKSSRPRFSYDVPAFQRDGRPVSPPIL
jgi:hypothetical protein